MPELPEVEMWRRSLSVWLEGETIREVVLLDPAVARAKLSTRPSEGMEGASAWFDRWVGQPTLELTRVGKRLGWRLQGVEAMVHLGMTGRFVRGAEAPRGARVGFVLGETTLWFVDTRRFGCIVPVERDLPGALRRGLGPDALLSPLSGQELSRRCRSRRAIKMALLDQARLAGLGNIHAVEVLWRAQVSPDSACADLDPLAWDRLAAAIPLQLREALEGITVEDFTYITEGGDNPFAVYQREGLPCPRCAGAVRRMAQGGRSTFWCPSCQLG